MPGVFNSGLISGNTRIEATVVNDGNTPTTGLRVGAGQHMTLTGLLNTGRVEVQGGELSNSGSVSHSGGSFVLRDALLRTDQGFENQALITVSFGTSDIHGALGNARGGKIILSGNSNTTFHYAVDARSGSELRVSAVSTAVFFGAVAQRSGAVFSGAGSKFYEGGLSVGASPGLGLDAGNVSFGAGSEYLAEIGGSVAGTQFDHYGVGGTLTFGGTLRLVSWAGYTGQVGDVYDLFDWGQVAGRFDTIDAGGFRLAGGARLDTTALYIDGSLRVVAVPEPATTPLWLVGGFNLLGLVRQRRAGSPAPAGSRRPAG